MCTVNIRGHEGSFYEAEARCHEAEIEARKSEAEAEAEWFPWGEVTSQYPWPRHDRHFVRTLTWHNV